MKQTGSLGQRLVLTSLALAILPMLVVGGLAAVSMFQLGTRISDQSTQALETRAKQELASGAKRVRTTIQEFMQRVESDASGLSESGAMKDYLAARSGNHPLWNQVAEQEMQAVLQGIERLCVESQEKTLTYNMRVAEYILQQAGTPGLSETEHTWQAVNQLTRKAEPVTLPILKIGPTALLPNTSPEVKTPIVDDIAALVGGFCTIFVRMNEQGDMLRVATTVLQTDGTRAVGTFIPAVHQDGTSDPVVRAILQGQAYQGRAFVVDAWCQTAYHPLTDGQGRTVGMLFVGHKELDNQNLVNSIVATRIGREGYPFVMDGQGTLLMHRRPELVGKNTIQDLKITEFRKVLAEREEGQVKVLRYTFEGQGKVVCYTYLPKWDWILCTCCNLSDMSRDATAHSKDFLVREMLDLYQRGRMTTPQGPRPMYPQIRLLTADGQEEIVIKDGRPQDQRGARGDADWFKQMASSPPGTPYTTALEVSKNTGRPEVRLGIPVYEGSVFRGAIVLNVDWDLTREVFAGFTFGKTGYPYMINDQGILITHPKYTLKDHVDLTDPKYGVLAGITSGRMLKGQEGIDRYEFEGVKKIVAFVPLNLGPFQYTIVSTCPTAEFMELADRVRVQGRVQLRRVTAKLLGTLVVLALLGAAVGLWTSRSITRPLCGAIAMFKEVADGDLTRSITATRGDEIGILANHFNGMVTNLKEILGKVQGVALQIATAGQEIQTVSETQAASAKDQSSAVSETTVSASELSKSSEQIGENIKTISQMAGHVLAGMEKIKKATDQTSRILTSLNEKSKQIGAITELIDDVADQTNLLAVNASIEAARAGEQGRGFTVVADQIGKLADSTARSTKDITSLVEMIRHEMNNAILAMDQSLSGVEEEIQLAKESAAKSKEIAMSANQQISGSRQIAEAMSSIDQTMKEIAGGAQRSAESAGQLTTLAEELKASMGRFRTVG